MPKQSWNDAVREDIKSMCEQLKDIVITEKWHTWIQANPAEFREIAQRIGAVLIIHGVRKAKEELTKEVCTKTGCNLTMVEGYMDRTYIGRTL